MINSPVLVLNQNYQPLNVCNARRAIVLMGHGKAELLLNGRGEVRTVSQRVPIPSVIRLIHMVKRPLISRRMSRRAVFHRDGYACQYCGNEAKDLTLDHVHPRSRGGGHTWENVVTACIPCNHRKAGNVLKDARMKLRKEPTVPRPNPYYMFFHRQILEEWRQFMPWLD